MGRKPKDITGQRFGKLTVAGMTNQRRNGFVVHECKCDCGKTTYVTSSNLKSGHAMSCGCVRNKKSSQRSKDTFLKHNKDFEWVEDTTLSLLTSKKRIDNKSGTKGVCWNSSKRRWQSTIKIGGKSKYLGRYLNIGDAIDSRKKAEQELFNPVLEKYGREPIKVTE